MTLHLPYYEKSFYQAVFNWNEEKVTPFFTQYLEDKGFKLMSNSPFFRINGGLDYTLSKFNIFIGGHYGNGSEANDRILLVPIVLSVLLLLFFQLVLAPGIAFG